MSAAAKRQEFRVVLEGVALPEKATAQINTAIQQTVATELARLDLGRADFVYHIDPGWLGFVLRRLRAGELEKAGIRFDEQTIGR